MFYAAASPACLDDGQDTLLQHVLREAAVTFTMNGPLVEIE